MHQLDASVVPRWHPVGQWWFPSAVSASCPFCNALVAFRPENHNIDKARETIASTAACPACHKRVHIWAVKPGPSSDKSKRGCEYLSMFPSPHCCRQPIPAANSMPSRIRLAYSNAFKNFEARIWSGTGTECGRTLEALVAQYVPEENRSKRFVENIEQLAGCPDLHKPIEDLGQAVRQGRNVGAHFDPDKELDEETAEVLLDLTEFILEYVFGVPEKVEELKRRLEALDQNG